MTLADLGSLLNVIIVLVFIYLAVSIACSAILEAAAAWLDTRARMLRARIVELLDDASVPGLAAKLYQHALIRGLGGRNGDPAYIPSTQFASAVLAILREQQPASVSDMHPALAALWEEAKGDADLFQARVAQWYDAAMERLSGVYKRRSQLSLFIMGLLVAASFNLDSFAIVRALWQDRTRLEPVVEAIARWHEGQQKRMPANEEEWRGLWQDEAFRDVVARLQSELPAEVRLPFGWGPEETVGQWANGLLQLQLPSFAKLLGWLITALAAMLGSQFWFNVLGRALQLRATGRKPAAMPAAVLLPGREEGP